MKGSWIRGEKSLQFWEFCFKLIIWWCTCTRWWWWCIRAAPLPNHYCTFSAHSSKWHHLTRMAALVSVITCHQLSRMGRSGHMSSIFICVNGFKCHQALNVGWLYDDYHIQTNTDHPQPYRFYTHAHLSWNSHDNRQTNLSKVLISSSSLSHRRHGSFHWETVVGLKAFEC